MFNKIIEACDERFKAQRHGRGCNDCRYDSFCPKDIHECGKCLELVHYPDRVSEGAPPRKYDCNNMADYYVCKYSSKYVSELIYAFEGLVALNTKAHINVLSFGCGPCTDLMALVYLKDEGIYRFETLEYRGVDYGEKVWASIHNDFNNNCDEEIKIKFYYKDAKELISTISESEWSPDIVTFQYFFSDMQKNSERKEIIEFINAFAKYANNKIHTDGYIILNDINLSTEYKGGRNYFDYLFCKLVNYDIRKWHFTNNNPGKGTYKYGEQYEDNSLRIDIASLVLTVDYSPYSSCSSAQMLLRKRENR